MKTQPIQPETAILNTWVNGQPFTISGDYEAVADQLPKADEYIKTLQTMPIVSHVEPTVAVEPPKPAYEDFATLEPREVLRRKISAKIWDMTHGSNMYGLFTEKLEDDRNVAMAQRLGIISSVHCLKHQK